MPIFSSSSEAARFGARLCLVFGLILFGAIVMYGYVDIATDTHNPSMYVLQYFLFMTIIGAIIGIIGSFIYWYEKTE